MCGTRVPHLHEGHVGSDGIDVVVGTMAGSIAGSSVCFVKGQGIGQEFASGALPRSPEAVRPYSRTGCGSDVDCTALGGTDEHGTKFGGESVGVWCEADGEDRRKVGVAGGCPKGSSMASTMHAAKCDTINNRRCY